MSGLERQRTFCERLQLAA